MPEPSTEKPKRSTHAFKLRMRTETYALIDRAAQALSRSRSDFIIDAARRAAEDAILDLTPGGRGTDWYPKLRY